MHRLYRIVTVSAFALAACPARADAIDGNWCSPAGGHISIAGPSIVTADGQRVTGRYSRHAFAYTVPEPAATAGQEVQMRLLNEFTLQLRTGDDPAAPIEVWKRCELTS